MNWKSTITDPTNASCYSGDQRLAHWCPTRTDGFGLPLVALLLGYQPSDEPELELLGDWEAFRTQA